MDGGVGVKYHQCCSIEDVNMDVRVPCLHVLRLNRQRETCVEPASSVPSREGKSGHVIRISTGSHKFTTHWHLTWMEPTE